MSLPDRQQYRLSARVRDYMDGSSVFQHSSTDVPDPEARDLEARMLAGQTFADGSIAVDLDRDQALFLRGFIECMEIGGSDSAWRPEGLADLNAARALLRKLPR